LLQIGQPFSDINGYRKNNMCDVDSADPRIKRLLKTGQAVDLSSTPVPSALGPFEVFVKPQEGKPFQHEGIVHAADLETAFVLAKETFTRRFCCVSLFVADTRHIATSPITEGTQSVFEVLPPPDPPAGPEEQYEIFYLFKRGKQHIHVGSLPAVSHSQAMIAARSFSDTKTVYSIWTLRSADVRFTKPEEETMWLTLPEKTFRGATDYKGGERLKEFLGKRKT
jgi:ring-1,2-phenylacetyl-CoA epoxidase subunit PaaB